MSSAASAITSPVRDLNAVASTPVSPVRRLLASGTTARGLTRMETLAWVVSRWCTIVRIMFPRSDSLPALARFAVV